ncbi:MAG: hypothetical protein KDA20_00280 [Phycisphaerales bacterium]|nr:hypothetical protein [Phycisphaerales bacterium]
MTYLNVRLGLLGLVASATMSPTTLAGPANLLDDGNFSMATSGGLSSNSAWSLTANTPDGFNLGAQFQTGFANAQNTGVGGTEPPGTGTGIWFRSFEGNQGGSGEPLAQASLTQSVMAPANGDYTLMFAAGRETNFIAGQWFVSLSSNGIGSPSVLVDLLTAAIPDGNLGGAASGNPGGTLFSITLPGVSVGDTLTVTAVMVNGQDSQIPGGQSGFLDSFALVPAPGALALPSVAFLVAGCRGRRRR